MGRSVVRISPVALCLLFPLFFHTHTHTHTHTRTHTHTHTHTHIYIYIYMPRSTNQALNWSCSPPACVFGLEMDAWFEKRSPHKRTQARIHIRLTVWKCEQRWDSGGGTEENPTKLKNEDELGQHRRPYCQSHRRWTDHLLIRARRLFSFFLLLLSLFLLLVSTPSFFDSRHVVHDAF